MYAHCLVNIDITVSENGRINVSHSIERFIRHKAYIHQSHKTNLSSAWKGKTKYMYMVSILLIY